jgi:hypothetical protein
MRAFKVRISIAFALLAPLSVLAQVIAPIDLPKVIFCSGQCFAVDDKGVRTPVTKGALLREGQRLETGPGAYAQLKVGQAAELAVSERGRVSFDQKSVGGRDLVVLDQGRIRMIAGDAMGKTATRALELRTADGTFALKGADVEVKKLATAGSNLTFMKVNNGNASLRSGQSEITIPKEAVQGVTGGKVIADRTFSLNEVALPPVQGTKPAIGPGSTLTIAPAPIAGVTQAPFPIVVGPVATTSTLVETQGKIIGACITCTVTLPPTIPNPVKPSTLVTKGTVSSEPAPITETLNTTLSVVLKPVTTTTLLTTTATTAPLTTTTTSTTSGTGTLSTTLSTTSLSTTSLSTCLSCTSLTTLSPTTTTSTTTTTGTLSTTTTKLTSTTLTLSSGSLLLK